MSIPRSIRFDTASKIIQVSSLAGFRMEHHQVNDLIKYLERHPGMDYDASLVRTITSIFRHYPNYSVSTFLLPLVELLLRQWETDMQQPPVTEAVQTEVAVDSDGGISAGKLIPWAKEEFLPGS